MRPLLAILFLAVTGGAQSLSRNTVTFEGGWAHNSNSVCCGDSAASLGLNYSYRFHKYGAAEAGVIATFPLGTEYAGAYYDYVLNDRYTWVPFGVRGIAPLANGRVELSLGGGGLYEKYSANTIPAINAQSRSGWGGYAVGGAAVALDKHHRFWLSATPRFVFANTTSGYRHDRWFVITGGIGIRF